MSATPTPTVVYTALPVDLSSLLGFVSQLMVFLFVMLTLARALSVSMSTISEAVKVAL